MTYTVNLHYEHCHAEHKDSWDKMSSKSNKSIVKIIASVSGIVLLSKVLGFVKQMITANAFGTTIETDLISLSEGLISNMDYLLVQALSTAFLPLYIHIKTESKSKADKFVSNSIKVFFIVTVIISSLIFVLSPFLAKLLAPSYHLELTIRLSRYMKIFAPALIIIVEMAVFNALLKANEHFIPGEFIGFNQSVIVILFVVLFGAQYGPNILVAAFYVCAIFNLIYLMVCSRKLWLFQRGNPFRDSDIKRLIVMMGPLLLGYSMVFVNQQVDKMIVSGLGEGTITAMGYAATLSNFVCTFAGSICSVMFTYITQNIAESKEERAAGIAAETAVQMVTFLIPISIIAIMNSGDFVKVIFGRGKFGDAAIENCSMALIGYCLMFVPYILRELFSRFQYAYGDSKQPMINSSIAIVVNIFLSILLSRRLGVLGVTAATSVSVLIAAGLNIHFSKRKNSYFEGGKFVKCLPMWFLGSTICIILSIALRKTLAFMPTIIRLIIITIVSLLAYGVINISMLKQIIMNLRKKESLE